MTAQNWSDGGSLSSTSDQISGGGMRPRWQSYSPANPIPHADPQYPADMRKIDISRRWTSLSPSYRNYGMPWPLATHGMTRRRGCATRQVSMLQPAASQKSRSASRRLAAWITAQVALLRTTKGVILSLQGTWGPTIEFSFNSRA
jgi:hypothetical protein